MPEDSDEFLSKCRIFLLCPQPVLAVEKALVGIEMQRDQVGEQPEHADRRLRAQCSRHPVDSAERPKKRAVGQDDRHRDIALQPVHLRRMMHGKHRVSGNVVDNYRLAVLTDVVADRCLDLQFAARLQAKGNVVPHAAGNPAIFCDPGDCRKSHAGGLADNFENGGNGIDPRDGPD